MNFETPLLPGQLVRRYKRFLADVVLAGGEAVTVHVPNSGAMTGLDQPGSAVWLSRSARPGRKYPLTLELIRADGVLVGVNTMHPNRIVAEAIGAGRIPELAGYPRLRREVRYGRASRVDLLLASDDRPPCYVEVKNVHLRRPTRGDGRTAEFPDCPTARGARHLEELSAVVAAGGRAVMIYLVQRADCDTFRIAADLDPVYAVGLDRARAAGVEAYCYACTVTVDEIDLDRPLTIGPGQ
jgi:sugar fermentation stimulation protein A